MKDKVNFRFELKEKGAFWRIEIPRKLIVEVLDSNDDPIFFEGTFDTDPSKCVNFVGILNEMQKKSEKLKEN